MIKMLEIEIMLWFIFVIEICVKSIVRLNKIYRPSTGKGVRNKNTKN